MKTRPDDFSRLCHCYAVFCTRLAVEIWKFAAECTTESVRSLTTRVVEKFHLLDPGPHTSPPPPPPSLSRSVYCLYIATRYGNRVVEYKLQWKHVGRDNRYEKKKIYYNMNVYKVVKCVIMRMLNNKPFDVRFAFKNQSKNSKKNVNPKTTNCTYNTYRPSNISIYPR